MLPTNDGQSQLTEELRIQIWDFLYRAKEPRTIDEIASHVYRDAETVRTAIDHQWFNVVEQTVNIA